MQSEKLFNHLKDVAEKLGVTVVEQRLQGGGIHVRSGLCRIKGEKKFILEKKLPMRDKIDLLADCLCTMDLNGLFLVPQIRDLLDKHLKRMGAPQAENEDDGHNVHNENNLLAPQQGED